jgi:hypothetical protein
LALELYGSGVNLFLIFNHYILTFLAEIWSSYQIVQRPVCATAHGALLGEDGNPKPQSSPSMGFFPQEGYHNILKIVTDKLLPLPSQTILFLYF